MQISHLEELLIGSQQQIEIMQLELKRANTDKQNSDKNIAML